VEAGSQRKKASGQNTGRTRLLDGMWIRKTDAGESNTGFPSLVLILHHLTQSQPAEPGREP
jgi:hypothetical protein